MALATDIAEALVTALNAHAFSVALTAERHYLPSFELKELKDLRVTVVPKGVAMSMAGRGISQHDVQIDVAVQKKLTAADNAEIDELMGLVEEIAEFVRAERRLVLPAAGEALWVNAANEPVYAPEHLAEQRTFTSVLTLTYRVIK